MRDSPPHPPLTARESHSTLFLNREENCFSSNQLQEQPETVEGENEGINQSEARVAEEEEDGEKGSVGDKVPVDGDVEFIEEVEWATDDNPYGELAPRPKPDPLGDPCGCSMPPQAAISAFSDALDPTQPQGLASIKPRCCMDPSCILFACQEECRSNCEAGPLCGNKRIQRRQWKQVEVFNAGSKGRGLRLLENVKKGDFLLEYVGRAVRASYLTKLFQRYKQERRLYIMALDGNIYLDARKKGSVARYINHSCEPNCVVERWKVRGIIRAGIFALKDIAEGEELSFDYQWERKKGRAPTKCYCGSATCRGTLEVPKSLEEREWEKSSEGHWKHGAARSGREIINRSIRILSKEHQQYFYADVCKFDDKTKKHLVIYRHDWEEVWEDLAQEEWQLLDEEAGQEFVIAKKALIRRKQQKLVASPSSKAGARLLAKIGAGDKDPEELKAIKPYLYVQTPIKDAFWAKHLIERCERNCRVTIQPKQFARPPLPPDPNDPDDMEKHKALDESLDGIVWKLTVSGYNVAKACTILERNVAYLTKQLEGEPPSALGGGPKKPAFSSTANRVSLSSTTVGSTNMDHIQEVVMPRNVVDNFKRRLPLVREKCRSVNITFAHSESKSKQFAKIVLEATLQSDMISAREHVWTHLNAACAEANAPKAQNGIYRDLGFLGGELTGEQFRLLMQNERDRLSQDCREDLRRSPFFASFESTQRCTVWVQAEDDKGRIDGSNNIVGVPEPNAPRKIFFGCDPKHLTKLWTLVQTRALEVARGVKYMYLGADRVYQPFMMMQNREKFFDYVTSVTGAAVMVDLVTGDHVRIDGRIHRPQLTGVIDVESTFSETERVALAQELIRLQIEIYRDHCIRQQNWIFGRDWSLSKITTADICASEAAPSSTPGPKTSTGAVSIRLHFDEKSVSNACQEIADITTMLGLDASIAASATTIFYRFVVTLSEKEDFDSQLKIREVLLACLFLANKSQKVVKWKRLDAVLEAAYQIFYPGAQFDRSKEEALVLGEKVLMAETEILTVLNYDVFWRGVEWILTAAKEAGGFQESLAKAALDFACSGPVLAAGSALWLKYGVEYIFAAAAGFLEANLESLFPALSLIPLKVLHAAELITESAKFGAIAKRSSHALLEGGKDALMQQMPQIKETCVKCMAVSFSQQETSGSPEYEQMLRLIGSRDYRRYVIRGAPRHLIKEFIWPAVDDASAESKCNIYIGESATAEADDIVFEGSWRAVAIAEHLLRTSIANGVVLPQSTDISVELSVANKNKLQAKGMPGLLSMNDVHTFDGWNDTIQSEVLGMTGWGSKTGGKICVAGKVTDAALRDVGLRWWIPPQHGPSPTGSICDMFFIRCNPQDVIGGLQRLTRSFVGESKAFPVLTCSSANSKNKPGDRYVAVSLQRWPSEKVETRELEKSKKSKGAINLGMGFSAAALQEMQLLTELHSIIPSPQGHPNFILPVALALPSEERDADDEQPQETEPVASTVADDIFSLFRTSEENEKVARREQKRKELVTGPHFVFQPAPFVLQRFISRKKRRSSDENNYHSISPAIFSGWFHDLLSALVHCHSNHVILRSIQADQIIVDHSGVAKVGGLYRATVISREDRKEPINPLLKAARARRDKSDDDDAASNPYAAPENLLGSPKQSKETDIWALGCLLANVLLNKQLFAGKDRESLLLSIYKVVGAPTKDNYPIAAKFPLYSKPPKKYKRGVEKALKHSLQEEDREKHSGAIDLLSKMLHLDPNERITSVEALRHPYMLEYMAKSNSESFRQRFVEDWMSLKRKLMKSTLCEEDEARVKERNLKRKAVLMAASSAVKENEQDDLYNMDELFGDDAKKQKLY
jgi:serine/threonine protein kinase